MKLAFPSRLALATLLFAWSALTSALEPERDASEELTQLFDRIWQWQLQTDPEFATWAGEPGYNHLWTERTPAATASVRQELEKYLAELSEFDATGLTPELASDLAVVRQSLSGRLAGFEFPQELLPLNQMGGPHQNLAQLLALMPTDTQKNYEDIVARLESAPIMLAQTQTQLAAGVEQGITLPQITLRDIPAQLTNLAPQDPTASPMYQPFLTMPANIPAAAQAALRARARTAIEAGIYPALSQLKTFLEERYIPAARPQVGLSALPNGREWYEYLIHDHTTLELSPETIHTLGLKEVERISRAMEEVRARAKFEGDQAAFLEFLSTDPQFFKTDRAQLVDAYRALAKTIDPQMVKLFGTLPRLPYGVMPVPTYAELSQATAYYEPGSMSAGRPANFFINTSNLAGSPSWQMAALILHEAVPGHHLQIALAQERENTHALRKNLMHTAYVEGWGLYAEQLGEELGLYEDPYAKFGQLSMEMWRAIRLVVDTGMHALGWSRQQAIDYFDRHTNKSQAEIIAEVDRYIVWPGQALAYKLGQLKISQLRQQSEQALGEAFDLRAFHDLVLRRGSVPLPQLERDVLDWIKTQTGGDAPAQAAGASTAPQPVTTLSTSGLPSTTQPITEPTAVKRP